MHAEYRWIFAQLEADPAVRAVVVTGTPPAFCVGADSEALRGTPSGAATTQGCPTSRHTPGYGVRPELDHDFAWHSGCACR